MLFNYELLSQNGHKNERFYKLQLHDDQSDGLARLCFSQNKPLFRNSFSTTRLRLYLMTRGCKTEFVGLFGAQQAADGGLRCSRADICTQNELFCTSLLQQVWGGESFGEGFPAG